MKKGHEGGEEEELLDCLKELPEWLGNLPKTPISVMIISRLL